MNEKIIWCENPSQLLNMHKYILGILILLFSIYFIENQYPNIMLILAKNQINISVEEFKDHMSNVILFLIFTVLFVLSYNFFSLLLTNYTLSNERLIIRKGIIQRKRDYTDLYRIIDYADQANIIEQIFGLDTILIYTTDKKKPVLKLRGMRNAQNKISSIREYVEKLRLERNVFEIN